MAWGSAQEASALFGLMHLYPTSQLEEVGLCWVDARQQIPASWGIPLNDLPPLGASPDGLIRHKAHSAPPPPTDFPVPATLLEQAGLESHKPGLPEHTQSQQSAARNQKAAGIEGQSSNTVQTAPAVDAEFEALLTKLAVSAKQAPAWSPAQQPSHNQSSAYQQQSTLGSAAFPRQTYTANHTQTRQSSDDADQSAAQPTTAFSHDAQPEQTAARLQQPATTAAAEDVSNSMDVRQHDWFEAVEIKNVCPFRELRQTSANGKTRRVYHLSDPGPYSRVGYCCCPSAYICMFT